MGDSQGAWARALLLERVMVVGFGSCMATSLLVAATSSYAVTRTTGNSLPATLGASIC
jgi:hypothetical protein